MRTIRVVDFETAGEAPPAPVIEVGWCDVVETGAGWEVSLPGSFLCYADRVSCETRAVHHISQADLAGLEPFYAQPFVQDSARAGAVALAAHSAQFEGQWLDPVLGGMPLICTYKAALRVWPDAPAHKNSVLRYWLEDQGIGGIDHALAQPAHRAGPDAYVTAHLLAQLLTKASVEDLIAWTKEPSALPRCPIGKWRGQPWANVDAGFLDWMLRQRDMSEDLRWNARRELDRRHAR